MCHIIETFPQHPDYARPQVSNHNTLTHTHTHTHAGTHTCIHTYVPVCFCVWACAPWCAIQAILISAPGTKDQQIQNLTRENSVLVSGNEEMCNKLNEAGRGIDPESHDARRPTWHTAPHSHCVTRSCPTAFKVSASGSTTVCVCKCLCVYKCLHIQHQQLSDVHSLVLVLKNGYSQYCFSLR